MQRPETEYTLTEAGLKLSEMAAGVAKQPGYQDFMTLPIMSSMFRKHPDRQQTTPSKESDNSNKQVSEEKTKLETKDPEHTKIGPGTVKPLKNKDSVADILAKMYNFMKMEYHWESEKSKDDIKYHKDVNAQKDRFLDETIEALTGQKPSKSKSKSKKGGLLKYGAMIAGGLGTFFLAEKALANINWKEMIPDLNIGGAGGENLGEGILGTSPDDRAARKSAEDYLGRSMSDKEWDMLLRATSAEASNKSTTEQSGIMATILNRSRDNKETIEDTLMKDYQFQAVTGAGGKGFHQAFRFLN